MMASEATLAEEHARAGMRKATFAGLAIIVLLVFAMVRWAATAEIASAVIAAGTVVVESSVKKIQHPTGGIVKEVRVKNGDRISAGHVLIRLDETVIRMRLDALLGELDTYTMRQARLEAERDDLERVAVPEALATRAATKSVSDLAAAEADLFESRRAVHLGQKAELRKRILQLREEIAGVTRQAKAKADESKLVEQEIEAQRRQQLYDRDSQQLEISQSVAREAAAESRLLTLRREAARLAGERGQLDATAAQLRGRIAEIDLQILRLDHETRSEILADLAATKSALTEIEGRTRTAEEEMRRVEISATTPGTVHELAVHGAGDIVTAGETLMLIVPDGDRLVVEAKIDPRDIDQVLEARTALLRFASFNQRTTPELNGAVTRVSADLTRDARTGSTYFTARVEIDDAELNRLEGKRLVPGMPAEVQIETQSRTALSYLLKPIEDQLARAWKER